MKRILPDARLCSGCRRCELICSFAHERTFQPSVSRIFVFKEDIFGFDLPLTCLHCDSCVAMESCPSKSLRRDSKGHLRVDEEKCSGCGLCMEKCPVGAIRLHPERRVPLICDLCGGKPLCVKKCPTEALSYSENGFSKPKTPDEVLRTTLKRWGITKLATF